MSIIDSSTAVGYLRRSEQIREESRHSHAETAKALNMVQAQLLLSWTIVYHATDRNPRVHLRSTPQVHWTSLPVDTSPIQVNIFNKYFKGWKS